MPKTAKTDAAKNLARGTGQPTQASPVIARNRQSLEAQLAALKQRLLEISDLNYASAVLGWDQATYMPPGGAAGARAPDGAAARRLAHERSVDPELGRLIDALTPYGEQLPYDSDDAELIRVARRDFEKAIRVPADYVARASAHGSASYEAWTKARPANDFAAMAPFLEKNVELSREYAGFFAPYAHVADPHDRRRRQRHDDGVGPRAVRRTAARAGPDRACDLRSAAGRRSLPARHFRRAGAAGFRPSSVERLGYDFDRGRLDKTHHPFCTKFSTRRRAHHHPGRSSTISARRCSRPSTSPAMPCTSRASAAARGTPPGSGASAGVHESQSRLWENVVARGRGFWEYFYPRPAGCFPDQFRGVPLETSIAPSTRWSAR